MRFLLYDFILLVYFQNFSYAGATSLRQPERKNLDIAGRVCVWLCLRIAAIYLHMYIYIYFVDARKTFTSIKNIKSGLADSRRSVSPWVYVYLFFDVAK